MRTGVKRFITYFLPAILVTMALFTVAIAINRLEFGVNVNVVSAQIEAVGPTSFSPEVSRGDSVTFDVTIRNTTTSIVDVQFFATVPAGLTLTLPDGFYRHILSSEQVRTFTWTLTASSTVPLGAYTATIIVDDPV